MLPNHSSISSPSFLGFQECVPLGYRILCSYRRDCLLHAAAVHVGVDTGVKLVHHAGIVRPCGVGTRTGG